MKIGTMCLVKPEAWAAMERHTSMNGKPTSQPITQIGAGFNDGWVMLAFPFWWWREEDLIVQETRSEAPP